MYYVPAKALVRSCSSSVAAAMAADGGASLISLCCVSLISCFLGAGLRRGGWGDAGGELLLLACARTCCGIAFGRGGSPHLFRGNL